MNKETQFSASQSHHRAKPRGGANPARAAGSPRIPAALERTTDVEPMLDALEVLKSQHREVKRLFSQFKHASHEDESLQIALLVCQKLTVHAAIEEELIYPAARLKDDLKDVVLESLEEHQSMKRIIADIEAVEAGDETLEAKLSVLEEQVTHHVKEEESELFPKMKKAFPKRERRALGAQLVARAEALEAAQGADVGDGDDADVSSDPSSSARSAGSARGSRATDVKDDEGEKGDSEDDSRNSSDDALAAHGDAQSGAEVEDDDVLGEARPAKVPPASTRPHTHH